MVLATNDEGESLAPGSEGPSVLLRNESRLVLCSRSARRAPPLAGTSASLNAIDYLMQAKAKCEGENYTGSSTGLESHQNSSSSRAPPLRRRAPGASWGKAGPR
ncbi:unnamed protein product [Pleuronectes platessa]|uniref:Uncharacterized protein n=1 Tax=Pleuronectes platessa TaxID=8262 RepID=A0A9N7UH87_PLEPL|nr:unnamed protein product [Pleuronectes platessa]